jgi:hypothetical protein
MAKEEGMSQLLFPLLTKILEACDISILDDSSKRKILEAVFNSIGQAIVINPEATVTFLENISKERNEEAIAGAAIKILADKAGIKIPPDVKLEDWLGELGLTHLTEKALQSLNREKS